MKRRHTEKGMALVITLMMLAITTFIAVVFLSLSRRERTNVKIIESQNTARLMADNAAARAQADLTAGMINAAEEYLGQATNQAGGTNLQHIAIANGAVQNALFRYDLRVSKNFINPNGFKKSAGRTPWNVSYWAGPGPVFTPLPLNSDDFYLNVANLQYDPRPPVIVNEGGTNDFRFYIDLNRNGMYDDSEVHEVTDPNNQRYSTAGVVGKGPPYLTQRFSGDPEWIGVLEHPDQPHSETNRFVGRYAYIMMPTGKSLDVNFIHNAAAYNGNQTNLIPSSGNFSRNQGVGPWELNLAAFLVDLHTNVWKAGGYVYTRPANSQGYVFDDALGLLQYRLNRSRGNLYTPSDVLGFSAKPAPVTPFAKDYVDMLGDGPFVSYDKWYNTAKPITLTLDDNEDRRFWHGAEHVELTSEFPDVQRYFRISSPGSSIQQNAFFGRFTNAMSSIRTNTYDRYSYYRLLSQMGADSKPAVQGKIHLNFANEPGTISSNLLPWVTITNNASMPTPLVRSNTTVLVRRNDGGDEYQERPNGLTNFFLLAADAMLRASLVTNIYRDYVPGSQPRTYIWRTNYTIGGSYFDNPALNAIPDDPTRPRYIANTPVRPDFSITNIQIYHLPYATNQIRQIQNSYTNYEYTPEVHRILQVAANIYDNMTNNAGSAGNAGRGGRSKDDPFFPSVWRPTYTITSSNITISGWEPQFNASLALTHANTNQTFFYSPDDYFTNGVRTFNITNVSFYGQPWVIGVKKGWPNFNEFSIETFAQVTRKLEIFKEPALAGKPISTNSDNYAQLAAHTRQIYLIGLSNSVGLEAWNSYALANNRRIRIDTRVETRVGIERVLQRDLSNTNRTVLASRPVFASPRTFVANTANYVVPKWDGRKLVTHTLPEAIPPNATNDFRVPAYQVFTVLTNSEYSEFPGPLGTFFARPATWQSLTNTPDMVISITNRVRYLATDVAENRVIDYVTFDNLVTKIDLEEALRGSINASGSAFGSGVNPGTFWDPNFTPKSLPNQGLSVGVMRQIEASLDAFPLDASQWAQYSAFARNGEQITNFQQFIFGTDKGSQATNLAIQVPFTPSRNLYLISRYQANDPLVHYLASDLRDPRQTTRPIILKLTERGENDELGRRNEKRQAIRWDGLHGFEFQDPRVYQSDDWQFPIAKLHGDANYGITDFHYIYPSVGALGQIHRGTPWQTLYLKAGAAPNMDPRNFRTPVANWADWSGSYGTHPTNDWKLVSLFTTAINENAARGLLGVNQSGIAAWSAVLSGIPVITNSVKNAEYQPNRKLPPKFGDPRTGEDPLIQPGSTQLSNIVRSINDYRATRPMGVYSYMGEILGAPGLSLGFNLNDLRGNRPNPRIQGSPFLNLHEYQIQTAEKITDYHAFTDEALEAVPQRILSLVKDDEPRVTIYCFGQTLKPAPRSYVTSADFYNLCVNYQVTGEYVTKSVVRVEGELKNPENPLRTVVESFEVLPPFE